MKRIIITGIIFILIFSVFPTESNKMSILNNGNVLYVGGTGPGNYSKIQDAIDNASDGDTIFVYDDSSPYYENLVINKSIKLIGENRETTIIDGMEKGYVIKINAENITISNFKIRNGAPKKGGIGIFSDNAKILNNIITKNGYYGIKIYSDGNLIDGNKIYSHAWWSLLFDKSSKNVVRNNTMQFSKGGLYLMSGSNNNLIENNIMGNIEHAIDVYSKGNKIIGNRILGISDGIIISAVNNYIAYNNISDSCRCGIIVDTSYNTVKCNFLSNCGYCSPGFYGGIAVYSPNNIIVNNTFLECGLIAYSYPNKILNNSVNGRPLVYIEYKDWEKLDGEAGQIIVINSNHIKIYNVSINYTSIGIQLFNCNHCIIRDNNLSNNGIGIKCSGTNNFFYK